jgi:F0F1-type ATP synthase membrane subunit b/b'
MSSGDTERSAAGLTALPSVDQLRRSGEGFDEEAVRDAFDAFRRHTTQLQAQLRVLQAARKTSNVEPTGHGIRMDALHLIRAAAEFADTLERDAQTASATQLQRTEEEVRRKQNELQEREAEVERYRNESERQRAEILNAAKAESRDLLAKANADATRELREAETRGNRLLEQSRHQATELTNSARAEVEQTLEWARAQATSVMARAQKGAEQLLAAAGLGEPAIGQVVQSIVDANDSEIARSGSSLPPRPAQAFAAPPAPAPPAVAPPAATEPEAPSEPPLSPSPPVTPSSARPSEPAQDTQDDGHEADIEEGQPPAPPVTPSAAADTGQAEPAEDGESEPER